MYTIIIILATIYILISLVCAGVAFYAVSRLQEKWYNCLNFALWEGLMWPTIIPTIYQSIRR